MFKVILSYIVISLSYKRPCLKTNPPKVKITSKEVGDVGDREPIYPLSNLRSVLNMTYRFYSPEV